MMTDDKSKAEKTIDTGKTIRTIPFTLGPDGYRASASAFQEQIRKSRKLISDSEYALDDAVIPPLLQAAALDALITQELDRIDHMQRGLFFSRVGYKRLYQGRRTRDGIEVTVSHFQGRHSLVHIPYHSPDGFEWGYGGSGPADLALAILADYLFEKPAHVLSRLRSWRAPDSDAVRLYQDFKWRFVARFGTRAFAEAGDDVARQILAEQLARGEMKARDTWELAGEDIEAWLWGLA